MTNSSAPVPNPIVKNMYLEITNIAQGVNLAILVYILSTPSFWSSIEMGFLSAPVFAVCSFLIIAVFWIRYYLDTEILNRSFTVISALWFFGSEALQGITISFIASPAVWLGTTGLFLFFGAGFYWLNLKEIQRKTAELTLKASFVTWQKQRMQELGSMSIITLIAALVVMNYPAFAIPASLCALGIAVWQTAVTNDYRRLSFIETGL